MTDINELYAALQRADQAGDTAAAQRIAQAIQQVATQQGPQGPQDYGLGNAIRQGAQQGATFGFADEISAAARAAIDPLMERWTGVPEDMRGGDQSFADRYKMYRDDERAQIEGGREHHGGAMLAAEFVPGLMQGGAGLAKAAGGNTIRQGLDLAAQQSLRQLMGRSAATGAGYGAVAGVGYGEGEGAGGMAADAAIGAGMGGLLGGAMPAAGAGIKRAAANVGRRFGLSGGGVKAAAREAARREIMRDMATDQVDMAKAERMLGDQEHAVLADMGSTLRDKAKTIAKQPGAGGQRIRDFAEGRAEQTFQRVVPKIRRELTNSSATSDNIMIPENFAKAEKQIMQRARQQAKEENLWELAYREDFEMPRSLKKFLAREVNEDGSLGKIINEDARRAHNRAVRILNRRVQAGEIAPDDPGMTARYADELLRSLKSDIKLGSNPLSRSARIPEESAVMLRQHKKLMDDLKEAMPPEWHKARKLWAGEASNQEAFEAGKKVFSQTNDEITARMQDFKSASERDHYIIGALRSIEDKLSRKIDTGDILRQLRKTEHGKELMRTVFGGERGFRRFMAMAKEEENYNKLYSKIFGGSDTFENFMAAQETGGGVYGTLAGIVLGAKLGFAGAPLIGRFVGRKVGGMAARADQFKRDAMADLLLTRAPEDLISSMQRAPLPMPTAQTTLGLAASTQAPGLLNE